MTVLLPYIQKLTGVNSEIRTTRLPLYKPMKKKAHNTRFLRGHQVIDNGKIFFAENEGQGNGMLSSFLDFNMIGIVPPDVGPLESGSEIDVLLLPRSIY